MNAVRDTTDTSRPVGHAPGRVRLLLDGPCSWGYWSSEAGRYGSMLYRLVVYPPGTTSRERRWLRLAQGWPVLGFLAALVVIALGVSAGGHLPVISLAAGSGYLLTGVALEARVHALKRRSCELWAWKSVLSPNTVCDAEYERLETFTAVLNAADRSLRHGDTTPASHERIWNAVYEEARASEAADCT